VRRALLTCLRSSLVGALAAAALQACDEKAPNGNNAGAAFDAAVFGRPHPSPLSGEVVASARAVQNAARALAQTCSFDSAGVLTTEHFFDVCLYEKKDVAALHAATIALVASGLIPETGPAAGYVEEARMFDAFIVDVMPKPPGGEREPYDPPRNRTRGTLAHYQDLASAWNAMVPQDPTPVDVVAMRMDAGVRGALRWELCGGLSCVKKGAP
jgi:hypothetical protein